MKRDPYKTLLRFAGLLAIFVVVGIGVFYLCSVIVTNDYVAKRQEIERANAEGEIEFNTRMNELRNNANAFMNPITGEVVAEDLAYWERTLDNSLWRVEDEGRAELENTSTVSMDRADLLLGGLILVNPWHSIPLDYSYDNLVSVGSTSGYKIQVTDSSVRLFPAAYEALAALIDEGAQEGMDNYLVREGYRSNEEQTTLFEEAMTELGDRFSGDILIAEAKKSVNYPGTSEYQTGFSFRMDLYSRDDAEFNKNKGKFSENERGQWFIENSWKHGILLRFPVENFPNSSWESKTYKTGISSAMLLFRFVGRPHAAAMRTMDYCLEEYIEFLIEHPHITIYQDGAMKYEVFRIEASDTETSFTLPVPNPATAFQASFDNMGGIVMAYTYN